MNWLRLSLISAGLGKYSLVTAVCVILGSAVMVGLLVYQLVAIMALSFSIGIGFAGLLLEALRTRAKSREASLARLWPAVLDSLASASSAGISISEGLRELSESGPAVLRAYFLEFTLNLDRGDTLAMALQRLKVAIGTNHVDRLVELLLVVSEVGGQGFYEALKHQSRVTRAELTLMGEVSSKQGWVTGTAKFALWAPWIIVALLSTRHENVLAYSTATGSGLLITGLLVSIFAYQLIGVLGAVNRPRRVFSL